VPYGALATRDGRLIVAVFVEKFLERVLSGARAPGVGARPALPDEP